MPKEELEKKTLNLRKGDWEFLTDVYSARGVYTSKIVQRLVSNHVDSLRAKQTPVPENLG